MPLSRLVLGTAQLGMNYGLSNSSGQPSKETSFDILDAAFRAGINTFDTAFSYGSAEDVLGEWISARNVEGQVYIISKLKPHVLNDYPEGTEVGEIVRKEIKKSLTRLRIARLDGYLLHTAAYVHRSDVVEALRLVQREGVVSNIGVSIYDEPDAVAGASMGLQYIQIPYNVLDRRVDGTDFWQVARKNSVRVFARSPFLQGLLVMEPHEIPERLAHTRQHVEKFRSIAASAGLAPAAAALRFSLVRTKAEHVVFGVETLMQLDGDLTEATNAKEETWMDEVQNEFPAIEAAVVNPSLWAQKK